MSSLVVENAMILTLDAVDRVLERGWVLVRDGVIAGVGEGAFAGAADRRIDGRLRLVTPGLVNAHTHSQSSTMAGFGDRLSHPAFMWLTQAHTARRTREEIRLAVLLCAWAMLSTGTTAAIDHFPGQRFSADDLDAVLSAWHETGLRVALGMRFFDAGFADIGTGPAAGVLQPQGLPELRELMPDAVARWHGKGLLQVWPAPANPDRCSQAALLFCAALAEAKDLGLHTHLLETRVQARQAIERYGVSSVARLVGLGVLSARWSCAHCLWLSAADRDLMAHAGAVAVLNPESNARLGTGVADVAGLRRAGVRLALGTDGSGANDNQVMQEAMRAIACVGRTETSDRGAWTGAREALAMATSGGSVALRVAGLGSLSVGAPADFVLYRLDAPAWVPINDPVAQLVYAETGSSVDVVVVGGEVLLCDGRPTRFDAGALAAEVRAMQSSLLRRNADLFMPVRARNA